MGAGLDLLAAGLTVPTAGAAVCVAVEILPHGLIDALEHRENEPFLLLVGQCTEGTFLFAAQDIGGLAFYVQDDADVIRDLVFDFFVERFRHNVIIGVAHKVVAVLSFLV